MAESKGGAAFAKSFQKTLGRTKAKVLQSLGKADKTTDEIFKTYVVNFEKQQLVASVLQKELKHYLHCVKAMTVAAKNLFETVRDVYEPEWTDHHVVSTSVQSLDMLYASYEAELNERVHTDLLNYISKFPDHKEKISKRGRKLLDFDNARHEYDSVSNAKKKDEVKIHKAQEILRESRHTYEELNTELHRELPQLYDDRVAFHASNLRALFQAEATFHLETGKIFSDNLSELASRLETEYAAGQHRSKIVPAPLLRDISLDQANDHVTAAGGEEEEEDTSVLQHEEHALDLSKISAENVPANAHEGNHAGDAAVTPGGHGLSPGATKLPQRPAQRPSVKGPSIPPNALRVDNVSAAVTANSLVTPGEPSVSATASEIAGPTANGASIMIRQTSLRNGEDLAGENVLSGGGEHRRLSETGSGGSGAKHTSEQLPADSGAAPADSGAAPVGSVAAPADSGAAPIGSVADPGATAAIIAGASADSEQSHAAQDVPLKLSPLQPVAPANPTASSKRQVIATHTYKAEDEDELTFEPGELITLVPFDDPEEQDEGWEMGIKASDGAKGVFPANFTRPT